MPNKSGPPDVRWVNALKDSTAFRSESYRWRWIGRSLFRISEDKSIRPARVSSGVARKSMQRCGASQVGFRAWETATQEQAGYEGPLTVLNPNPAGDPEGQSLRHATPDRIFARLLHKKLYALLSASDHSRHLLLHLCEGPNRGTTEGRRRFQSQ